MRCPKCGYITFDKLDTCPSCKKDISKISQELSGVIFRSTVPDFLQLTIEEPETEDAAVTMEHSDEQPDTDVEFFEDAETETDSEEEIDFSPDEDDSGPDEEESGGIDFDLSVEEEEDDDDDDDDAVEDDQGLDLSMDEDGEEGNELDLALDDADEEDVPDLSLDNADEGGLDFSLKNENGEEEPDFSLSFDDADEPEVSLESEESGSREAVPSLDLSGLDISDLSASSTEDDIELSIGDLTLENSEAESAADGLHDLEMGDLDLDAPLQAPAGSATGKKFTPAAKTGTALDAFNIDLGELISEKKK